MKRIGLFSLALVLMNCKSETPVTKEYSYYLGTYTHGDSKGIYKGRLSSSGLFTGLELQAEVSNPSYLAFSADSSLVLAVEENTPPQSVLTSFTRKDSSLLRVSSEETLGAHPCHIAVSPVGKVVCSNYSGGSIVLHQLQSDGLLSPPLDTLVFSGQGPTDRQEMAHAHSSHFWPDEDHLLTLDLGSDRLWLSRINSDNTFRLSDSVVVAPGSGPRHAAFHPTKPWLYVLQELSSEIEQFVIDSDALEGNHKTGTLPAEYKGPVNTTAEIKISPDGKFLYISNRGHNSIAVFELDQETGALNPIQWESTAGETPRNFSLTPDGKYLVVGNQNSNSLVCFRRDEKTGMLSYTDTLEAPAPSYILFE